MFQKGKSGNPGGRPKRADDGLAVLEQLGGRGGRLYAERLHELATGARSDPHVRMKALTLISAYLWGKPIERHEHTGANGAPIPFTWLPPQSV